MENIVWKTLWKATGKSWDIWRFPYLCSPYSRPTECGMENPMEQHTSPFHPYARPMESGMLYLWKTLPQAWYPLGNYSFHTDDIPTETFSTGWLTPGKAPSIGWLYLWKANSIRILDVRNDITCAYYRYYRSNILGLYLRKTLSIGRSALWKSYSIRLLQVRKADSQGFLQVQYSYGKLFPKGYNRYGKGISQGYCSYVKHIPSVHYTYGNIFHRASIGMSCQYYPYGNPKNP